jgi:hypothetical protein
MDKISENWLFPTLPKSLSNKLVEDLKTELYSIPRLQHSALWEHIKRFLNINPSRDMPYHNNVHTALFIRGLFKAFPHFQLSVSDKTNLIVAALFHDFNYQTTKEDDVINVKQARWEWANISFEFAKIRGLNNKLVSTLIYSTYIESELSTDPHERLLQTLMRDSDMLCWVFEEYREIQRVGLELEKEFPITTDNLTTRFTIYNDYAVALLQSCGLD